MGRYDEYTTEILDAVKNNPRIQRGMMVDVFHDMTHIKILGVGIVEFVWWSESCGRHKANVTLFNGNYVNAVLDEFLERRAMKDYELRAWLYTLNGLEVPKFRKRIY